MFLGNLEEMDLIYPWSIVIIHCLEYSKEPVNTK